MKYIKIGNQYQYEVTPNDSKNLAMIGNMVMKKTAKFSHFAMDSVFFLTTIKIDI
jgi:hypothetical protein